MTLGSNSKPGWIAIFSATGALVALAEVAAARCGDQSADLDAVAAVRAEIATRCERIARMSWGC